LFATGIAEAYSFSVGHPEMLCKGMPFLEIDMHAQLSHRFVSSIFLFVLAGSATPLNSQQSMCASVSNHPPVMENLCGDAGAKSTVAVRRVNAVQPAQNALLLAFASSEGSLKGNEVKLCKIEVPHDLQDATFTLIYRFETTRQGKLIHITKIMNDFLPDAPFQACMAQWRLPSISGQGAAEFRRRLPRVGRKFVSPAEGLIKLFLIIEISEYFS
jgi:hypothetical protein